MPAKILVVDDEPDLELLIRQKFRRQIRQQELQFEFAQNGVEALEKLQADQGFDLVLTDINMPQMDGLTLLEKLPDLNPVLKAVIITAYGDMGNIRAAMHRGAYDFLTKPIDFEDLAITIARTLQHVQQYLQHVARLTDAAAAVEADVFTPASLEDVARSGGTLGRLARVFQTMAREVGAREQRLTQTEAALRKVQDELEVRVQERTAELAKANATLQVEVAQRQRAEEELRIAKEAAEAATQAKSAFLASMSHEIRTPMNAVIGISGLLLNTPLAAEQREFVDMIINSGDALLTIINDILDFSKIEAGKLDLENQPFDLRECIESACDLMATQVVEKGLDLAYIMDDRTPPAIVGDVTRLRQILVNLLSNALKFTDKGEVVLAVTAQPLDDVEAALPSEAPASYELHITVQDTGIGIPPDRIHRLFQSFSQVDASTTRKYGGTGLGLAISKQLSVMMGGTLWVESAGVPGRGSTFHCTVQAMSVPRPPRREFRVGVQPHLHGKRVLIVDDNATSRHLLALQAQGWGMLPRSTESPVEALAWIRRGDPFAVAILDMHMPEMDGVMLANAIRRYRDPHTLPLVLCSALGRRETGPKAATARFAAFLTKPLKPSQMFDVLMHICADLPVRIPPAVATSQLDPEMGARLPLRLLLAEDNTVNQKLALRLLQQMGYRADVAANGLEVLASLQRQPYDVVLMDVLMPEMDGLEASRRICQHWSPEERPRLIAMTANAMPGDRERCLQAGMDDYVSKPIHIEELIAALRRCQPQGIPARSEASPAAPVAGPEDGPPAHASSQPGDAVTAMVQDAQASVLEAAALERLQAAMGAAFVAELIGAFLEDAPTMLSTLRQACAQGDAATLGRVAHTLKANSASFGAMAFAELCKALEATGRTGVLDGAAERVVQVEAEYAKVRSALVAVRKGISHERRAWHDPGDG